MNVNQKQNGILLPKSCSLPRKQQAIVALFGIAWRKEKKDRPQWLLKELSSHS